MRDHHVFDTCFIDQQHAESKIYPETDIELAELEAFAMACGNTASYPVTLEEAVHGIAVQDAIIESARKSGALISVPRNEKWHPPARSESCFAKSVHDE